MFVFFMSQPVYMPIMKFQIAQIINVNKMVNNHEDIM